MSAIHAKRKKGQRAVRLQPSVNQEDSHSTFSFTLPTKVAKYCCMLLLARIEGLRASFDENYWPKRNVIQFPLE